MNGRSHTRSTERDRLTARRPKSTRPARRSTDARAVQRAVDRPSIATAADVLTMQHDYGNRAVQNLIQRKIEDKATTPSYDANPTGYFNVANQITSIMEGGAAKGQYDALTTVDDGGIISYGKHQATLAAGSLETILNAYVASSQSSNAGVIRGCMSRVKQKDVTLKDDKRFLDALRAAASEKEMQVAQDMIFSKGYWNPAVTAAQGGSIRSPLGFAMLYDTKIQGGMESCMKTARAKCGGSIGAEVGGKAITEVEFLKAFNDAREERLENIALAAEKKGEKVKAQAVRGSKYRCRAFRKLLEAGNLNVTGPEGKVEILGPGGKTHKIEDFNSQSGAVSSSPPSSSPSGVSKEKPQPVKIGTAKVITDKLNVRQSPASNAAKLGMLTRGTQVDVVGREAAWLRITYQSKTAYIHGNYAEFTAKAAAPTAQKGAPGLLDQTVRTGKELLSQGVNAGKELWNWAANLFDTGDNKPAQITDPQKGKSAMAYASQRDNESPEPDAMCNVTTLAMQIETLAGSREKAIAVAIDLLQKNGDKRSGRDLRGKQLEDLIMDRFKQITDKGDWPKVLGKQYDDALSLHKQGYPWNQLAVPLNQVGLEFKAFVAKAEHNEPGDSKKNTLDKLTSEKYYRGTLYPLMDKGKATVMLSTKLTSGHIVLLAKALNDGILINDPYGALLDKQGNYIKNGASTTDAANRIKKSGDLVVKNRLKHNTRALKKLMSVISPENKSETRLPQDLGELNFYTWQEIKKYSIGKWNNIVYKA